MHAASTTEDPKENILIAKKGRTLTIPAVSQTNLLVLMVAVKPGVLSQTAHSPTGHWQTQRGLDVQGPSAYTGEEEMTGIYFRVLNRMGRSLREVRSQPVAAVPSTALLPNDRIFTVM